MTSGPAVFYGPLVFLLCITLKNAVRPKGGRDRVVHHTHDFSGIPLPPHLLWGLSLRGGEFWAGQTSRPGHVLQVLHWPSLCNPETLHRGQRSVGLCCH